ncbi:unnamed protein product [Lupinus luteus]|uniref:Lipase-like PAD4 n=1 Tax=Lupinus luteus TaxID=3873 RepID=A0AAV1W7B3_LUPLU
MVSQASSFETSEVLATCLASTPLLSESWRLCSVANATAPWSFVTEQSGGGGGTVYVAFSSAQMMANGWECSWRNMTQLENMGELPRFWCHRNKEVEEPVMVHQGILDLFLSFSNSFQHQIMAIIGNGNTKSIVVTGHSIGGAIASLCTLWLLSYLQHISSSLSLLCITFGSPLLGNKSFSNAILKQKWATNFCHIVSNHDIMPRLLFAPTIPHTSQLNHLLQFWQLSMTSPCFGKLAVQVSENEKAELFNSVMSYLHAATQDGEGCESFLFHPFGSYLFVSEDGALCVDSPIIVIKMMHLTFATSSPDSSIEDHLKYGEYVNKLSLQFLVQRNSMQVSISESSYEAGLEFAVQSAGIANQDSAIEPAKECLKIARRIGPSPTQNVAHLAVTLSKVVPYRAEIEWYKAWCDDQSDEMGYYDMFKRRGSSKRGMKVNMNRHKLARFWDKVINMLETNELPGDFERIPKWYNASQFYKLLVEPLDIAEYYGKEMDRAKGHYIKHGRDRRYKIFDRWWKERVDTREENNGRSKFASLTQDSCFWARVEEAREWLNNVRSECDTRELAVLWGNIENFENYAMKLVENKEVSQDVLAKNSSYSMWLEDLREMRELNANVEIASTLYPFSGGEVVP